MRKQSEFVVRVWPLGNGANETISGPQLSREINELYLNNGYEVFSVDALQVSAGVIYYHVAFVKYVDLSGVGANVPPDASAPKVNAK